MSQVINTNIASLNAQRNLSTTQKQLQVSLERLSSGLRINGAKDDAAGLAISERMTAQIKGLNQAARNANDGISLVQTIEGALNEITNNLQRMRELAIQAANDTYGDDDRGLIQDEIDSLTEEITRVATQTTFNDVAYLDTSGAADFKLQVGPNENNIISVDFSGYNFRASGLGVSGGLSLASVAVDSHDDATSAINAIDAAIMQVAETRAELGAIQNRLESTIQSVMNTAENLSASRSRIQDADFAAETAALTRGQILQQAGTTVLAQANQAPQNVLQLLQG
ncbi:flagellin [Ectothiorhodospira variabilis]|uniref:flagellin N-terminal helical domain-containing protein n=1 Tax=Ectothiorhodospira variabilis TaxID=505694 RepID=UPI001EFB0584|nr:flagellin [Ectothiorhodospira variabilis]MCG5495985.1 flagellin FliC [Ectothiorhodospira variabilis]MCG5505340.1 flagellin FliC [Ectothiorhodospira variabilis]MCG5508526.1 flagellin FliC [Ectothiorhodospira variabilis]